MYSVSSGFKSAIMSTSRILKAKVMINSNTYDETYISDMSFEDASNPSDSFEIGAVASPILTLSLIGVDEVFETATIKPYIGLDLGGTVEYVPLGVFYADDVDRKKDVVTLTCYDGMIKLEKAYFSNLTYPATIMAVMNEICSKAGIQFTGTLPNYSFSKKPEGYTYREVVAFIAQMCGGFAKFSRDGKLTIKSYASISETITADSYVDFSKAKDQAFRVDKVTCQVDDQTISKGTLSAGGSEVTFENPFMTDAILTDVYNKLKGFQYVPIDLQYVGNPAYDVGDIVSLVTIDNETYSIPIMSHKLSYSGGLTGEIQSIGETENSNQFDSSGSVSKTVERVVYEQALIKEALIDKATIEDLEATNARIDNIVTNDLTAINAAITNLQAEKADITDLNAVNATIATLQADVGSINTLLAGNLGAENFQAGAIYAGSGVIAQGAIGDAEISNLNASKINAGILNTALVTIQGANGRLKMSGNRLQVFANKTDGTLYERVSLGDVNGDGSVYGLRVRGADGQTVLLDENGVKREGITDGSITDDKIADDANISGTKLDIASVVAEINEGTTTIQSSKIFYDGKTLDIQLGTMQTTINNQGQTITNHETRITATEQGLTTKVSVSQYQQDQAALSSQLSQMSTQIQQQANQIALKADSSNVYTKSQIDGQFTTVNTQISNLSAQLTVQADQIATKVSKTEFDALQIGGKNLVLNSTFNTGDFTNWSNVNAGFTVLPAESDKPKSKIAKISASGRSTNGYLSAYSSRSPAVLGDKFTFSMDVKVTDFAAYDVQAPFIVEFYDASGNRVQYKDVYLSDCGVSPWSNGTWKRISYTATVTNSSVAKVGVRLCLFRNGEVFYREIKIEKGDKATDWTPAPEDVQGQIDGLGSRMTTAETSITQLSSQIALKANQSTVDTLTGQVNSLQAQLTVQADQIATKVEKDGVISAINQTAESIKIQASKINLVGAVTVLSDITGNLGTINAGTINGVTITSQDKAAGLAISIANGQITGNSSTNNYLTIQPGQFILGLADANYYEPEFQAYPDFLMFIRKTADAYNQNFKISVSPGSTILQQEMLTPNNGFSYGGPKLEFKSDGSYGSYTHSITASADKIIFNGSFQANNWVYTDVIENNLNSGGVNIYIRPKNELRVTAPGSTTSYMPLRAANLYAASLDTNTGGSVYVRPGSNGSVHITVTGTTNQYRPIYASEHLTGSLAEYKQDIEPMTESALDIINAAKVHKYRLKSDVENGIDNVKYGLIIGDGYDTPNEFLSADRTAIDSYVVSAISLKAIQELDGKTTEIADDVEWLKTENDYLKQKVNFLENKLKELEAQIA